MPSAEVKYASVQLASFRRAAEAGGVSAPTAASTTARNATIFLGFTRSTSWLAGARKEDAADGRPRDVGYPPRFPDGRVTRASGPLVPGTIGLQTPPDD